jgi:hypothetical protein
MPVGKPLNTLVEANKHMASVPANNPSPSHRGKPAALLSAAWNYMSEKKTPAGDVGDFLECASMTALWNWQTCLPVGKQRHVAALQIGTPFRKAHGSPTAGGRRAAAFHFSAFSKSAIGNRKWAGPIPAQTTIRGAVLMNQVARK